MRHLLIHFLLLAGLHAEQGGDMRTWTSSDGKELEARMLGTHGEKVSLLLADGKTADVPLARLSEADRYFIGKEGWLLPKAWRGWPDNLQVTLSSIKVEDKGRKEDWHLYHTNHFQIAAQAELGTACIKDIARLLEGAHQLMAHSPWGIQAHPENGLFRVELFKSKTNYVAAGGPSNSAGVYLPDRKVFMVPFETLALKESTTGWRQDEGYSTKTLMHELTHMLMDDVLDFLPNWLVEGCAEYMELIPLRTSVFRTGSMDKELARHNKTMCEDYIGCQPHGIEDVFKMTYKEWNDGGEETVRYYHTGLLLTYYFIHLDGNGDAARLQRYISASAANVKRSNDYRKAYEAYEKEWEDLAKRPDVEKLPGGSYHLPDGVDAPKAPTFPFGEIDYHEVPFTENEILFEGRDEKKLLLSIIEELKELGIRELSL